MLLPPWGRACQNKYKKSLLLIRKLHLCLQSAASYSHCDGNALCCETMLLKFDPTGTFFFPAQNQILQRFCVVLLFPSSNKTSSTKVYVMSVWLLQNKKCFSSSTERKKIRCIKLLRKSVNFLFWSYKPHYIKVYKLFWCLYSKVRPIL